MNHARGQAGRASAKRGGPVRRAAGRRGKMGPAQRAASARAANARSYLSSPRLRTRAVSAIGLPQRHQPSPLAGFPASATCRATCRAIVEGSCAARPRESQLRTRVADGRDAGRRRPAEPAPITHGKPPFPAANNLAPAHALDCASSQTTSAQTPPRCPRALRLRAIGPASPSIARTPARSREERARHAGGQLGGPLSSEPQRERHVARHVNPQPLGGDGGPAQRAASPRAAECLAAGALSRAPGGVAAIKHLARLAARACLALGPRVRRSKDVCQAGLFAGR